MTFKRIAFCATALALSACQSTGTVPYGHHDGSKDVKHQVNAPKTASLSTLERQYKRNPDDAEIAASYAAALRKNDYINRAETILTPFTEKDDVEAAIHAEMAAILLEKGDYKAAEKFAANAVISNENDFEAYHRLGIALDAQAKHEPAERAFRKAISLWEGNPTTVMNNLSLNLASQKRLDESIEILRQAQELSPGRTEIERNLRIITALQQSHATPVPKPGKKPEPPPSS